MRVAVTTIVVTFLATAAAGAATLTQPLQQNGWLIYQDSHVRQAIRCSRQPILLRGNHTDLTLSGDCLYVRVAGAHNDISIEVPSAATIEITGAHNDVTWRQITPGRQPRLLNRGNSNTFHAGTAR